MKSRAQSVQAVAACVVLLQSILAGIAQEKPPTSVEEQEFPRALPGVRVNRPIYAEPWYVAGAPVFKTVSQTALGVGKGNVIHFVWLESAITALGASYNRLYYANTHAATRRYNGFSEPFVLTEEASILNIQIAADRDDNVYVVWEDAGSGSLKFVTRDGSTGEWTSAAALRQGYNTPAESIWFKTPKLVRYVGASADRIDLAFVRARDLPAEVTQNSLYPDEYSLRYVTDVFATGGAESVLHTTTVVATDFGLLLDNTPDLIDTDIFPNAGPTQPGGGSVVGWSRVRWNGESTNVVTLDMGGWVHVPIPVPGVFELATGRDDKVHFSYVSDGELRYRVMNGGTIGPEETPWAGLSAYSWRMVVSSAGNPRILAYGNYLSKFGTTWYARTNFWNDWLGTFGGFNIVQGSDDAIYLSGTGGIPWNNGAAEFSQIYEANLGEQDALATQSAGPASANVINGNLYFTLPLFKTAGRGLSTSVSLVYNSQQSESGIISRGWRHNFQIELTDHDITPFDPTLMHPPQTLRISVVFGNGRRVVFKHEDNVWIGEDEFGHFSWITRSYQGGNIENPTYILQTKGGMRYYFNAQGRLTKIADPQVGPSGNGNEMLFSYNNGRLFGIADSVGRATFFSYTDGRLTAVVDPAGHIYTLFYDSQDYLSYVQLLASPNVTWGLAHSWMDGRLNGIFTPRNLGTTNYYLYVYHPEGRFWKMTDPNGYSKQLLYLDDIFHTYVVDRRGYTNQFGWRYRLCTIWKTVDPLGNYTQRWPTLWRGVTQERDKRGNITTYGYEAYVGAANTPPAWVKNNLQTILRPGNTNPIVMHYNARSQITNRTDELGNVTTYEYDATLVNLIRTRFPSNGGENAVEEKTYDVFGRVLTMRDANGNATLYEYGGVNGGNDAGSGLVTSILRDGRTQRELFYYDVMGWVIEHRSPMGAVTQTQYDALGRVTQRTFPIIDGATAPVVSYSLDANGNVIQSSGPRIGEVTGYFYDAQDRLVRTINPLNGTNSFVYDAEGNLVQEARPTGAWSSYVYDALNRRSLEEHDAAPSPNLIKSYVYDPNGNLLTESLPALPDGTPLVTGYEYDVRNNRIRTTLPDGSYDEMTHDANDSVLARIRQTRTGIFHSGVRNDYDERRRLITVTEITNAMTLAGPTTTNVYDLAGNLVKIVDPLGRERRSEYDAANRPVRIFNALNVPISRTDYDDDDRRLEEWHQDPVANDGSLVPLKRYSYTPAGKIKSTRSGWNGAGYTKAATNSYDLAGNLIETVDEENNRKDFEFDLLNRLTLENIHVAPDRVRRIRREYDSVGNLVALTDGREKRYTFNHDHRNNLLSMTYPGLGGTERWTYSAQSWAAAYTDQRGTSTAFTYDARGRVIQESPAGFPSVVRAYDAGGNLVAGEMGSIRTEFIYDTQNRLQKTTWSVAGVPWKSVSYQYDESDRRRAMTDPENVGYIYEYDAADRLTSVVREGVNEALFTYDTGGRRRALTLGNGAVTTYAYDVEGRLQEIETRDVANVLLGRFAYSYNKANQRTNVTLAHHNRRIDYNYNGAYELLSERHFNITAGAQLYFANYEYDDAGNRTSKRTPDGISTYEYSDDNRLLVERRCATNTPFVVLSGGFVTSGADRRYALTLTGTTGACFIIEVTSDWTNWVALNTNRLTDGAATWIEPGTDFFTSRFYRARWADGSNEVVRYTYDANGNQTARQQGDVTEMWSYDAYNRIAVYLRTNSGVTEANLSYAYDAGGRRIYKQNHLTETTHWFAYEGEDVVADYVTSASQTPVLGTSYINSMTTDSKIGRVAANGAKAYYLNDALNTNHRMVDANLAVIRDEVSTALGETLSAAGIPDRYSFTGREKDEENGLLHFRARAFDPRLGRFIQRDPLAANRPLEHYLYAANNPVNRVDPMGADDWVPAWAKKLVKGAGEVLSDTWAVTKELPGAFKETFWDGKNPFNQSFQSAQAKLNVVADHVGKSGASPTEAAFLTFSYGIAKVSGVEDIGNAASGRDTGKELLTRKEEKLSTGERVFAGVTGTIQLVSAGYGGAQLVKGAAATLTGSADDVVTVTAGRLQSSADDLARAAGGVDDAASASQPLFVLGDDAAKVMGQATRIKPLQGFQDVVVHGNARTFGLVVEGKKILVSPKELAAIIRQSGFNQQGVRLFSCKAGVCETAPAQALASELGVPVWAPTRKITIKEAVDNTGVWELFKPIKP